MKKIDIKKSGIAIRELRRKAGLTQKELADKLFVSDKAVSKWERGQSIPDVSSFDALSTILNIDFESILEGNSSYKKKDWIGFIDLSNYSLDISIRIGSQTLIAHQISYIMLSGINLIYVKANKKQKEIIKKEIENINIKCIFVDDYSKIPKRNIMIINSPFFIFGVSLSRLFQKAMEKEGTTILCIPKEKHLESRIKFDYFHIMSNRECSIETEYSYFQIPIILMTKSDYIMGSKRNIESIIEEQKRKNRTVNVEPLLRGYIYIPLENKNDISDADELVKIIEKRDFKISNLNEIQLRRELTNKDVNQK